MENAVMLIADDNFCIKAVHKPKVISWRFDWTFKDEASEFVPKRPEHFMLRKLVSDRLNEKKLSTRPVWKGE
jgi:hypothetical protein